MFTFLIILLTAASLTIWDKWLILLMNRKCAAWVSYWHRKNFVTPLCNLGLVKKWPQIKTKLNRIYVNYLLLSHSFITKIGLIWTGKDILQSLDSFTCVERLTLCQWKILEFERWLAGCCLSRWKKTKKIKRYRARKIRFLSNQIIRSSRIRNRTLKKQQEKRIKL